MVRGRIELLSQGGVELGTFGGIDHGLFLWGCLAAEDGGAYRVGFRSVVAQGEGDGPVGKCSIDVHSNQIQRGEHFHGYGTRVAYEELRISAYEKVVHICSPKALRDDEYPGSVKWYAGRERHGLLLVIA